MKALIGYTGFVGSNIHRAMQFDALYNSRNYQDMAHCSFNLIICAGVSAAKWTANKNPDEDRAKIRALENVLSTIQAKQFVLISTIDVYPVSRGEDETFDCHSQPNHAYGTNRLAFEDFCRDRFANCCVLRLPGLFGDGLKKNIIYDLLHDNCLEMVNPDSSFQYYDLGGRCQDVERVMSGGLRTANLFTEPISTQTILQRFFPGKQVGGNPAPEAHYDLHSRHSSLWGRSEPYIASADQVLRQLDTFIGRQSGRHAS
jgi:nucleoside-diphosphate-sugar epimerase